MSGETKRSVVSIPAAGVTLAGDLALPRACAGIVLFAHGSGSSRHSPRNRHVAAVLQEAGLGTLLMDLLTTEEETGDLETGAFRFDIPRLTGRLTAAVDWAGGQEELALLPAGCFGASTGAAAALATAAARPGLVRAVVSRGGRPDLAEEALDRVVAPTLLIVGGEDHTVVRLNRLALARLPESTPKSLAVIAGATHLFEEPGTLDEAARLACSWFQRHLSGEGGVPLRN